MSKKFNPMTDVPSTDEEVMIALERSDELLTSILQNLYQARRKQGQSLLDAYEETLMAHVTAAVEEGQKS